MKVVRRKAPIEPGHDERRFWLYFSDGAIVDPRRCPRNIPARHHWRRLGAGHALLSGPGEPNAVCLCTVDESRA